MISEQSVKETLTEMLGTGAANKFNCSRISDDLNDFQSRFDIELSVYGFIKYAYDLYGVKSLYSNMGGSSVVVQKYAEEAKRIRDDMPSMLLNASEYTQKIFDMITDVELCFKQLEGMTFPHIMYILFAGAGKPEEVERYREVFEEHMLRYPSSLDKLPEQYKQLKGGLYHANS